MKHLAIMIFFSIVLSGCQKDTIAPEINIAYESRTWQLEAQITGFPGLPPLVINNERTLRFQDGKVETNGSFCDFREDPGPVQETDYDPELRLFVYNECVMSPQSTFSGSWNYTIDMASDFLFVFSPEDSTAGFRFVLID